MERIPSSLPALLAGDRVATSNMVALVASPAGPAGPEPGAPRPKLSGTFTLILRAGQQ